MAAAKTKTTPKRTPPKQGNILTRKVGPQPAWAWLTELGVAVFVWRRQQAAAATGSSTTPSTLDTSGSSTAPAAGGGGDSGGGSGGGLPPLPDMSQAPPPVAPVVPPITINFAAPPQSSSTPPPSTGVSSGKSGAPTVTARAPFASSTTLGEIATGASVGASNATIKAENQSAWSSILRTNSVRSTGTSSVKAATGAAPPVSSGAGGVKSGGSKVNRQAKARAA